MKKILLTCIAVVCSLVAVAEELLIEAESFSQAYRSSVVKKASVQAAALPLSPSISMISATVPANRPMTSL